MRAILFTLVLASCATADTIVVLIPGGAWVFQINRETGDKREALADFVLDLRQPGPDPQPPPGNVVAEVERISKKYLRNTNEARAMRSPWQLVKNLDDHRETRGRLGNVIDTLAASQLFPGNQFRQWKTEVFRLINGQFTKQFVTDVDQGIVNAFSLQGQPTKMMLDQILPMLSIPLNGRSRTQMGP